MRARTRRSSAKPDQGVALILVMLAILVLTTLAAAIVFTARSETLASYNFRIGSQATYVARAGIEKALNFFKNTSKYASLSPTTGPPAPTLSQTAGNVPADTYDVVVTMVTSTGQETAPSAIASITLSAAFGITVRSPGSQPGFTRYRVYAAVSGGPLILQTATDLGTDYTIRELATGVGPPAATPAPDAVPAAAGGIPAGNYDVAITLVNSSGGETPVSPRKLVTLVANGGITVLSLSAPPGYTQYKVYAVAAGGTLALQGTQSIGSSFTFNSLGAGAAPPVGEPTLGSAAGSIPPQTYGVKVTLLSSSGVETEPTPASTTTLSSTGGISVTSPSAQAGFAQYRVYAGSGGSFYLQTTADLGSSYRISPLASGLGPPASASPGLNPYYNLAVYAVNPANFYFTSNTAVQCSSNCSNNGDVTLGTSTGSSSYPPPPATLDATGAPVDVVRNWVASMNDAAIDDGMGGTGNYTVTATLLEYHTVNNAFFGVPAAGCTDPSINLGICRQPYEVWLVTSRGSWNNNIGAGAANPTVVMQATIAPLYLPYFGNALYGLCKTILSGNVCTDSYNSAAGTYGIGTSPPPPVGACATTSTTTGTNRSASGAGIGSNGGVTLNGAGMTIGGNVSFSNATGNPACDTGFQGNDSGVAGSVLPGPAVPVPPAPDMTVWGYSATSGGPPYVHSTAPNVRFSSGGGHTASVANVYTRVGPTPPVMPSATGGPGASCPVGATGYLMKYTADRSGGTITYANQACVALTGSGSSTDPYRLGNIDASSGSNPVFNIIGPANGIGDATYIAANLVNTGTGGRINFSNSAPTTPSSGAYSQTTSPPNAPLNTDSGFVVDVGDNLIVGGQASLNYSIAAPGVPSPDYLRMNVLGKEGAGSTGSCAGGSNAVDLGGQGALSSVITAPNGSAKLAGSGAGGVFFGSILALNILDCGNYSVHYDLSMRVQSGKLYPTRVVSATRPKM